jgi:hypothetical protein
MSQAEEKSREGKPGPETLEQRVAREREALAGAGILKNRAGTITRSTLASMTPVEVSTFFRNGGTVVDDPPPTKAPLPQGAIRRSTFDKMSGDERHKYLGGGGKIVDDHLVAD